MPPFLNTIDSIEIERGESMKKIGGIFIVLGLLFISQAAFAEPIMTGLWQVNSLFDDSGAQIFSLEIDIEVGRVYLQANGSIELEGSGPVPAFGSGYLSQGGVVFFLNIGQHLATVYLNSSLNGVISLYGPDNKLIDEGTVTYLSLEM
jgi:hypothetical protein